MVDISRVAISEGAEELKGQPFLLDILEEGTCAAEMSTASTIMTTDPTLVYHRANCIDTVSLDNHLCLSREFVGSQGHWVRPGAPRAHLGNRSILITVSRSPEINLLTPYNLHVLLQVKLWERLHN